MRRLYVQIYLTIIASLVLVVVVSGAVWHFAGSGRIERDGFEIAAKLAASSLASADAAQSQQQNLLRELADVLDVDLALYNQEKQFVTSSGGLLPSIDKEKTQSSRIRRWGRPVWQLKLPDQRWLIARLRSNRTSLLLAPVAFFGSVALVIGLCAFPVVRRLTRRLERLQQGVESIGSGDFSTRVAIEGKDEVAQLAASFNRAAEKIAKLLGTHQRLLANASHELRTPLSRIRLGIDLYKGPDDKARKAAMEQDINELDQLVDEILLMSRLDASAKSQKREPVDLLAIAAEECARHEDCTASGSLVEVAGDARLLHRMMRNLVENARRHGSPPVEVRVERQENSAVIEVLDHGPGIPEDQQEKVFAPFYRLPGRQNVQGYGLGLALVAQIVESHDGKVTFIGNEHDLFGVHVELPVFEFNA